MAYQTKITTAFDSDSQCFVSGDVYHIFSNDEKPIISKVVAKKLMVTFATLKLNRYYDCIRKALIVAKELNQDSIRLGSLMVQSTEKGVAYGYAYNPPIELHAWVQINKNIIDLALPGTIEKGLKTRDDIGFFLIGREPIILAGLPPVWAKYTTHKIVKASEVAIMDKSSAKNLINKMYGNISV